MPRDSKNRRISPSAWKYPWLVYDEEGLWCIECVAMRFDPLNTQTVNLVNTALKSFKKLTGKIENNDLEAHDSKQLHKKCTALAHNFVKSFSKPTLAIDVAINKENEENISKYLRGVKIIFSCLVFLCRQNIPIRGHRENKDSCKSNEDNMGNMLYFNLFTQVEKILLNQNIRELVDFVSQYSADLQAMIKMSQGNCKYTSKRVQEEVIKITGDLVMEKILEEVNQAECYCIVFDETTDRSNINELVITIKYVNKQGHSIERFLKFINGYEEAAKFGSEKMDGKTIASIVKNEIEKVINFSRLTSLIL